MRHRTIAGLRGTTALLIVALLCSCASTNDLRPDSPEGRAHSQLVAEITASRDVDRYRPLIVHSSLKRYSTLPKEHRTVHNLLHIYQENWDAYVNKLNEFSFPTYRPTEDIKAEAFWTVVKSSPPSAGDIVDMVRILDKHAKEETQKILGNPEQFDSIRLRANARYWFATDKRYRKFPVLAWYEVHQAAKRDPIIEEFVKTLYLSEPSLAFDPTASAKEVCLSNLDVSACLKQHPHLSRVVDAVLFDDQRSTEDKSGECDADTIDAVKDELAETVAYKIREYADSYSAAVRESAGPPPEPTNNHEFIRQLQTIRQAEAGLQLLNSLMLFVDDENLRVKTAQYSSVALAGLQIAEATLKAQHYSAEFGGLVLANQYAAAAVLIHNAFNQQPSSEQVVLDAIVQLHRDIVELRHEMRSSNTSTRNWTSFISRCQSKSQISRPSWDR